MLLLSDDLAIDIILNEHLYQSEPGLIRQARQRLKHGGKSFSAKVMRARIERKRKEQQSDYDRAMEGLF
jgi:hypothetical protein